ncbi:MAG TPA: hypothetical protein VE591_08050 [Candidatus Acidoferrum sp.]|nr:hypothetical protein [Candidatus Acidoferrum sp.]
MRARFEFTFHLVDERSARNGDVDATLALMGEQGWEIRGVAPAAEGRLTIALQRTLDEETPLPDGPVLAATLAEPLAAPSLEELERDPPLHGE